MLKLETSTYQMHKIYKNFIDALLTSKTTRGKAGGEFYSIGFGLTIPEHNGQS